MSSKSERQKAREEVAAYHEGELSRLVTCLGEAIDKFRAGELDAFDVDQVISQYSQAAKSLWKFCNIRNVEITARFVRDEPPRDWWDRTAPRQR